MEENNEGINLRKIDLGAAYRRIKRNKKLYAVTLAITFILSVFIILSVPRYYTCSVKLAPETSNSGLGGISSLASSFGLNMSNMTQQDAILPEFYPDVIESVDFQTAMFPVMVSSKDNKLKTSYYEYLYRHQKSAWWTKAIVWTVDKLSKKDEEAGTGRNNKVNPFKLTKTQNDIATIIGGNITCRVDKKTDVITITVKDQDPLICATIADSAKSKLQQFIIRYRTSKARNDLQHAQELSAQAKARYIKAQQIYAAYSDANEDLVLQSFKSKQEEMENEMQLRYNNYQMTTQQVQLAQAKLQERTPAFTTLQSASMPIKPAGPKRMLFVLFCLLAAFAGTTIYVYRKNL